MGTDARGRKITFMDRMRSGLAMGTLSEKGLIRGIPHIAAKAAGTVARGGAYGKRWVEVVAKKIDPILQNPGYSRWGR